MNLTFDLGNTRLRAGLFHQGELRTEVWVPSADLHNPGFAETLLKNVLRHGNVRAEAIHNLALSSVVPAQAARLQRACFVIFGKDLKVLNSSTQAGISLDYLGEVPFGSDRLANLTAAADRFPLENILVVDLGTATTFCVLDKTKKYRGGFILPGLGLSLEVLAEKTAQLPLLKMIPPKNFLGLSTAEAMRSGVYFQNLFFITETVKRLQSTVFSGEPLRVIGTGGLSNVYLDEGVFDWIVPDLVLRGLNVFLNNLPSNDLQPSNKRGIYETIHDEV